MPDRTSALLAGDQMALVEMLLRFERRLSRLERRGVQVGQFAVGLSDDLSALVVRNTVTGAVTVIAD